MATITAPGAPFAKQDWATAAVRTVDAMRRGVDVVYQGRLESGDGRWSGYPDFLIRVEAPSALGAWSYEAADAKLARTARGTALLQLLLYSDLLATVQEREPERMHLALGGGDGRIDASFRVVEYAAYYRAVRRTFEAHADAPAETYPEPVDHCRALRLERPLRRPAPRRRPPLASGRDHARPAATPGRARHPDDGRPRRVAPPRRPCDRRP